MFQPLYCYLPTSWLGTFRLLIGLSLGSILSCGAPVDHSKYIPAQSNWAICINLQAMQDKSSDWPELLNQDIPFLQISSQDRIGDLFKSSGINFQEKAFLFSNMGDGRPDYYIALTFKLNNESDFDRFLRDLPNQNIRISSFSGMRYTLINDKTILGWSNRVAYLISKSRNYTLRSLKDQLLRLRDLPEDQSLKSQNEQFRRIRLEENDLNAWVDVSAFGQEFRQAFQTFPLPLNLNLQNNFLTLASDFNLGEIISKFKLYNGNQSLTSYQNLVKSNIDPNFISNIPLSLPMGFFSFGLNPSELHKVYKQFGGGFFEKSIMSFAGCTTQELLNIFDGDLITMVEDIKINPADSLQPYEFLLGLGVAQPQELDSLLMHFRKTGFLIAADSFDIYPRANWYVLPKQNILFLTPSDSIRDHLLQNQGQNIVPRIVKLSQDSFFLTYVDVKKDTRQKIPSAFFQEDRVSEGVFKNTDTPFESLTFNIQPFQNKINHSELIIQLSDKETNALQLMVEAFRNQAPD